MNSDAQSAAPQVLVVDDDASLRDLLGEYLTRQGLVVSSVADGDQMLRWLERHEADIVILDLMLPGTDGLTLARALRQRDQTPIIMLSARGDEVDRIVGLEVGADDYLAKPFNPRELLARIRAVLRRPSRVVTARGAAAASEVFTFGPYRLDRTARRLSRDGLEVPLTSSEVDLLGLFAEHPNQVLDRDRILDLLRGYERNPFDRSIDVQVARLRAKIEPDKKVPRFIRTVWGRGYMFTPAGED